jgi:hypothetical protein
MKTPQKSNVIHFLHFLLHINLIYMGNINSFNQVHILKMAIFSFLVVWYCLTYDSMTVAHIWIPGKVSLIVFISVASYMVDTVLEQCVILVHRGCH